MAVKYHIKLMVVENNPKVASSFNVELEKSGYRPRMVSSGRQALKLAEQESFQIAVVDLALTDMEGMDVVEGLKQTEQQMGVVVITPRANLDESIQAMRRGSNDYLVNPVSPQALLTSVEEISRKLRLAYTDESEMNHLIGKRIRTERMAQRLTLREIADRTKLTTSQLSQVELGKNAASLWALARICHSLGKEMSSILGGL